MKYLVTFIIIFCLLQTHLFDMSGCLLSSAIRHVRQEDIPEEHSHCCEKHLILGVNSKSSAMLPVKEHTWSWWFAAEATRNSLPSNLNSILIVPLVYSKDKPWFVWFLLQVDCEDPTENRCMTYTSIAERPKNIKESNTGTKNSYPYQHLQDHTWSNAIFVRMRDIPSSFIELWRKLYQ